MIISFFGYCIFLRSTKINAGPPKVSSLVDRMSTNVLSAISKTALGCNYSLLISALETWAPSQYPKRRLSVRSRKVSTPRDLYLELSDRSEIWQALRQQCCRCACQISKRYDNLNYQSRGFETLRDLTKRRLFGYWDGALLLASLVPKSSYRWVSARKTVIPVPKSSYRWVSARKTVIPVTKSSYRWVSARKTVIPVPKSSYRWVSARKTVIPVPKSSYRWVSARKTVIPVPKSSYRWVSARKTVISVPKSSYRWVSARKTVIPVTKSSYRWVSARKTVIPVPKSSYRWVSARKTVIPVPKSSYRWVSARKTQLQCLSNGVTFSVAPTHRYRKYCDLSSAMCLLAKVLHHRQA